MLNRFRNRRPVRHARLTWNAAVLMPVWFVAAAAQYDIANYFVLDAESSWYYADYHAGGDPVDASLNFRWTVEEQFESLHGIQATRIRHDADDPNAPNHGDVAFWSIDEAGHLLSHGLYKGNAAPPAAGDQMIVLSKPVVVAAPGMSVGWRRVEQAKATVVTDNWGTLDVTITSTSKLVAVLPVKQTPLRDFENVIVMHTKVEAEASFPFVGKVRETMQNSLLFMAPGYGVIAVSRRLDPHDPRSQALTEGRIGQRPIPAVEPPPGLALEVVDNVTDEAGGTGFMRVTLNSVPLWPVTVTIFSLDETEGIVHPDQRSATFTPLSWSQPHEVTVIGQDDDVDDGDVEYFIAFDLVSDDPAYHQIEVDPVPFINLDDDTAGVTVRAPNPTTSEDGDVAILHVALDSKPLNDVSVRLASMDPSEGVVAGSHNSAVLVFTPQSWNIEQAATVIGRDDDVDDGDVEYAVALTVSSADPKYDGLPVPPVALVNINNDFTLSGSIAYAGRQPGIVYLRLYAGDIADGLLLDELHGPDVFDFTFTPLPAGPYSLLAFRDSGGNGEPGMTDAIAGPDSNPIVLGPSRAVHLELLDADTNLSGLPDWWELQHFGNLTSYTADCDPDNDGLTNADEYALDTDPLGWRFSITPDNPNMDPLELGMQTDAQTAGDDPWDRPYSVGVGSDAFFTPPTGPLLREDVRPVSDRETWWLTLVADPADEDGLVLTWSPADIPRDRVILLDEVDDVDGNVLADSPKLDMTAAARIAAAPGQTRHFRLRFVARHDQVLQLREGWNAVSLYVKPITPKPADLFDDQVSGPPVYWNGRAYVAAERMVPCRGYWIFRDTGSGTTEILIEGRPVRYDDSFVVLRTGWRMRGPATPTVAPAKPGLNYPLWTWNAAAYERVHPGETLAPGQAYWFHVNGEVSVELDTAIYGP